MTKSPRSIEQDRRDFKRECPDLYAYILDVEMQKVWDSAGDNAANDPRLANMFYHRASVHETARKKALDASAGT